MSDRAAQILARFPAHLEPTRPGKQLGFVAEQLAQHLDVQSAQLAAIRRAHRLGHADVLRDVLFLGALHAIGAADLDALARRCARLLELAAQLEQAAGTPAAAPLAETLFDLFAVDASPPRLPRVLPAPSGGGAVDQTAAAKRLAALVRQSVGYSGRLEATRQRVQQICRTHAGGNGTVRALLEGAANALDLELDEEKNRAVRKELLGTPGGVSLDPIVDDGILHSTDRFWHSSFLRDRFELPAPLPDGKSLPHTVEFFGLEENPLRREYWPAPTGKPPVSQPSPQAHASRFALQRRGFGRELLEIFVTGVGNRTMGPMLVNRDEGRGIGYFGPVPDGKTLVFTEEGRAVLDGADVTANAYSWQGACFALPLVKHDPEKPQKDDASDDSVVHPRDFVFDGPGADPNRVARFAVVSPLGALDREAPFPHAGEAIDAPGIGLGQTRFAVFVQAAHLGAVVNNAPLPPTPRPVIGFFDESVFDPDAQPAMKIGLSWREHEAYAVRVLIPARFAKLDTDGTPPMTARVRAALERFRPAGVDVRVEYIDDRWVLGEGVLVESGGGDVDPTLELHGGTVVWPSNP
jgi:hypothetical protein